MKIELDIQILVPGDYKEDRDDYKVPETITIEDSKDDTSIVAVSLSPDGKPVVFYITKEQLKILAQVFKI